MGRVALSLYFIFVALLCLVAAFALSSSISCGVLMAWLDWPCVVCAWPREAKFYGHPAKTAANSQEQPGAARSSQESSQESSQKQPGSSVPFTTACNGVASLSSFRHLSSLHGDG